MAYLIDTCVFIGFLTARLPEEASGWLEELVISGFACTSAVVYHELLAGASTIKARKAIDKITAPLDIVPVDKIIAAEAASIRRVWRNKGKTLNMADTLIGATAKLRDLVVLTCNLKDFPGVLAVDPYSVTEDVF